MANPRTATMSANKPSGALKVMTHSNTVFHYGPCYSKGKTTTVQAKTLSFDGSKKRAVPASGINQSRTINGPSSTGEYPKG